MEKHFFFWPKFISFAAKTQLLSNMKAFNVLLVLLIVITACKQQEKQAVPSENNDILSEYAAIGKEMDAAGAKNASEMAGIYNRLKEEDTLSTKFSGTVTEVCQAKGCWMKVQLQDGKETLVKFKDYGFFVPLDITGKEVIVNGIAFVEEMSVEEQQHVAEDAGHATEIIASIKDKKKTYGFEADGVLIAH